MAYGNTNMIIIIIRIIRIIIIIILIMIIIIIIIIINEVPRARSGSAGRAAGWRAAPMIADRCK